MMNTSRSQLDSAKPFTHASGRWFVLGCLMFLACADAGTVTDPSGEPPMPLPGIAGIVVSDAVPFATTGGASYAATGASYAYVSLAPGTVDEGVGLTISNRRTGAALNAELMEGGLDPVAIAAETGDTLDIVIARLDGSTIRGEEVVNLRRPPIIVRTVPPRGKRDVPLNTRVIVVFSEPMAAASLTSGAVQLLLDGASVPGSLEFTAPDGIAIALTPAADLQSGRTYTVRVTSNARDLDGQALETDWVSDFATSLTFAGTLAFTGGPGIHVSNVDGSGLQVLTAPSTVDYGAVWSPDRRRIAFSRHDGFWGAVIHVMDADGTNVTALSPPGAYDADPSWSPDGKRIAFENRADNASGGHIFVMNADGSNRIQLTSHHQPTWQPAWSPDGTRIAYTTYSDVNGKMGIYLINANGTGRTRLTPDSLEGWAAAWSPDGQQVAFTAFVGEGSALFVMNADGTGLVQMTTGDLWVALPAWSPDGGMIAFNVYSWCDPGGNGPGNQPGMCPPDPFYYLRIWGVRVSDGRLFSLPISGRADHVSWRP